MTLRAILRSTLGSTALLLTLTGCAESAAPVSEEALLGTWELASLDGQPLPTNRPCGVFRVESASLRLGPARSAIFEQRYAEIHGGQEVRYSGAGSFRPTDDGDGIEVTVRGRWSHMPDTETSVLRFRRAGPWMARTGVGMECDANATEMYGRRS